MSQGARKRGNNGIWNGAKEKHFDSTKKKMSIKAAGSNNSRYRSDLPELEVRKYYARTNSLTETAKEFGCSVNAVRLRLRPKTDVAWMDISDEDFLTMLGQCGGSSHRLATKLKAPPTSVWRRVKRIKEITDAS